MRDETQLITHAKDLRLSIDYMHTSLNIGLILSTLEFVLWKYGNHTFEKTQIKKSVY